MATTKIPEQFLIILGLLSSIQSQYPSTINTTQSSFELEAHQNVISNETANCLPGSWACSKTQEQERETWFSASLDSYLSGSSVLYGIIRQSSLSTVSQQCHVNLQSVAEGIHRRDVWAMKSECLI